MRTAMLASPTRVSASGSAAGRYGLLLSMIGAGLVLWIGIPVAWIWGASQLVNRYPAVYGLALIGCPLTMAAWGWVIGRLNAAYVARRPHEHTARPTTGWLRSLSAERRGRGGWQAIDVIMACEVVLALVLMALWFFAFAGSPTVGYN